MESFKVVCIGGFGHLTDVLDDMVGMANVRFVGYAPAYIGEDLEQVKRHELCKGSVRFYEDFRQMLKTTRPRLAIVSTRLDLIAPVATEAAGFGCHLICEKPLAIDYDQLDNLYAAVKTNRVSIMAMFSMRRWPAFIAARNACLSGQAGEIVLVNARKSYKWGQRPPSFARRDTYGGTIGWVGIHALDMIRYMTARQFTSAAAMQSNFAHKDFGDCEDNCVFILGLDNGGHATISVDIFRPEAASTWGDDWIRIVGTKAVIEANGTANFCNLLTEQGESKSLSLGEPGKTYYHFISRLIEDKDNREISEDSFMLTYSCLCARDAADKGIIQPVVRKFIFDSASVQ